MQHHDHERHPAPRPTYQRRSILASLAVTCVAGWGGAASSLNSAAAARAQEASQPRSTLDPPRDETYVGPTSDPETLIAIVLLEAEAEKAVAYLCRGAELNIWFTGRHTGNTLKLASGSPPEDTPHFVPVPTVTCHLDPTGIAGEVLLPDRTLTFTAIPATGLAGLYVADRDGAGNVLGASSTGATLEARQVAVTGAAGEAPFRIAGTVILENDRHFEITIPAWTTDAALFRWIALADGSVRGAGRRRRGNGDDVVEQAVSSAGRGSDDGDKVMDPGLDF